MDVENKAIKFIGGGLRFLTELQFPHTDQKCSMEPAQARKILSGIRECRPCIVEGSSRLTREYDLMIVIPAYNVQDYVEECMDSILNQTTQYSFRVKVIDDGSRDRTGALLDRYQTDSRVTVIHQNNGGIACARNAGLETITGRYVMFVDSDDILCPDAIQKLLQKAYALDADLVEGSKYSFNENGSIRWRISYEDTEEDSDFSNHHGVPWGCVIRAEIFEHLRYPDSFEYEDSIMAYCVFPSANKKYTISHTVYGYRHNKNSISRTASKTPGCIDTYYISFALWKRYYERFEVTKSFNLLVLRQIAINYNRTANWGTDVLKSGYCLQRLQYMSMFPDGYDLEQEYKLLDAALRNDNWGQFALVCRRWNLLQIR